MMRKILTIIQITILGLFAAGGMAGAAQAAPYPPPAGPTIIININITINGNVTIINGNVTIILGDIFLLTGGGFDPGEGINVTSALVPSGLRSSAGLSQLAASNKVETKASEDGTFETPLTLNQVGETTIKALGQSSGKSATMTVFVVAAGASGGGGISANAVPAGSGSNADSTGLAYTGASIAGPLAIGFVALLAGLTLLFFGTRGVRRRKHAQAGSTS